MLQSMGSQKLDMTERLSTAHNPRFLKPTLDLDSSPPPLLFVDESVETQGSVTGWVVYLANTLVGLPLWFSW